MHAHYATKKELKAAVGQSLRYSETSMFGPEYRSTGKFCVCNVKRTWFAEVVMEDGKIKKVS
jgi:hypothetical protein